MALQAEMLQSLGDIQNGSFFVLGRMAEGFSDVESGNQAGTVLASSIGSGRDDPLPGELLWWSGN